MTTHIGKAHDNNFQIVFPVLPIYTSTESANDFRLNIFDTILPSITIPPVEHSWMGSEIKGESGGIEYGDWTTTFQVDDNFDNYITLYDWMMYINNTYNRVGRKFGEYEINGDLLVFNNYNLIAKKFTFNKIWPSSLGELSFSYGNGREVLSCSVTFMYDWFDKTE